MSFFPFAAVAGEFFGIVEYKPSSFVERATTPFFYSIGKQLKFGDSISESAPAIFQGKFTESRLEVFPSPDQKKATVVSGGNLYLVEAGKPAQLLLEKVSNDEPRSVRVGKAFYKYTMLQWDEHSRYIYIAKDKKQKTLFEQGFSKDAVLVRIDIKDPSSIIEVVLDFRSIKYFFLGDEAICFNYALGNGDVIWKCSLNGQMQAIKKGSIDQIELEGGRKITGRLFQSYMGGIDERDIWLSRYGFSLKTTPDGYIGFYSANLQQTPVFRIRGGINIKGHYSDGITQFGCSVLPGGRFALLNVWHDNFKGQLLIDGVNGRYRELPRDTKVYQNLNSFNYENVIFNMAENSWPEFLPMGKRRVGE
jgi:hypothetical protein